MLSTSLVTPVIHFHIVSVHIDLLVIIVENGGRAGVPRVAGHVVGYHQDDLAVGDAKALDAAVDGQNVGHMAIVEPESGSVNQHSPVVGVARCIYIRRELQVDIKRLSQFMFY